MARIDRGRHVSYTAAGVPIIRALPSDSCVASPLDFWGPRHVGYTATGVPILARTLICCDAVDDCPRVEEDCLAGGITRQLVAHAYSVENCDSAYQSDTLVYCKNDFDGVDTADCPVIDCQPGVGNSLCRAGSGYLAANGNIDVFRNDGSDFIVAVWVYLNATPAENKGLFALFGNFFGFGHNWALYYDYATDTANPRYRFAVADGMNLAGADGVRATGFGAPPATAWTCLVAGYKASTNEIRISVNGGTPNTATISFTPGDGGGDLTMGSLSSARILDGCVAEPVFLRVTNDFDTVWNSFLPAYNNAGSGQTCAGFTPADVALWGLVACWPLTEAGPSYYDSNGGNEMVEIGTAPTPGGGPRPPPQDPPPGCDTCDIPGKGKWVGALELRAGDLGGILQLELCCFISGGDLMFRLIYRGCDEGCTVDTFPGCLDPLIVSFQITLPQCCQCEDTDESGTIAIIVVGNCHPDVTARHVTYTGAGIPVVAEETPCPWSGEPACDCPPGCGLTASITNVDSCACLEGTVRLSRVSGHWENLTAGACDLDAVITLYCTDNGDGTVTLTLTVLCGATNTGSASLTIPCEDTEDLDETFDVTLTDLSVGACGTCTFQWNAMAMSWSTVGDGCTPPCECVDALTLPPGSVDGEQVVVNCAVPDYTPPCCLGTIAVRLTR